MSGALDGMVICLDARYSASIDADPPLRHAEIRVDREGFALDDGDRLEFRDHCEHVFESA